MDFRLNEFQELLKGSAEDFLSREAPPSRIREIEAAGEPNQQLWNSMVDLGWTGLPIEEQYGGQGGTLMDTVVLIKEMCRHALLSPYENAMISALTIQRFGDEALKQALLPRIAQGAVATPANAETGNVNAPVQARVSGGKLDGKKLFVEYARSADTHLVTAVQDGTPGIALVPRDQAGVTFEDLKSIGGTPQAAVTYSGATADAFIAGQEAVDYLRRLGAAVAAFECYANAQQSLDMIVDYAQMRVQFGRPIGAFDAVQQRVADMAIQVEASRFLTQELLWTIQHDVVDPGQVATVKAVTSKAVTDVTMWSHILHGGIGYMKEYDLQFYTRRGKEAALRWGDVRESMNAVADAVLV